MGESWMLSIAPREKGQMKGICPRTIQEGRAVIIFRVQCEGGEPFREGERRQDISHLAQEAWVSPLGSGFCPVSKDSSLLWGSHVHVGFSTQPWTLPTKPWQQGSSPSWYLKVSMVTVLFGMENVPHRFMWLINLTPVGGTIQETVKSWEVEPRMRTLRFIIQPHIPACLSLVLHLSRFGWTGPKSHYHICEPSP